MDAITDRIFTETSLESTTTNDDPTLLTIVLDVSPLGWYNLRHTTSLENITKSLLVFLNGHLALNNSNQVAFIASSSTGSKFLYPHLAKSNTEKQTRADRISQGMYRQFKNVNEVVLEELIRFVNEEAEGAARAEAETEAEVEAETNGREDQGGNANKARSKRQAYHARGSTITGAMSMALTYTNRMLTLDQSITTTTASAMSTASLNSSISKSGSDSVGTAGVGVGAGGGAVGGGATSSLSSAASGASSSTSSVSMNSRILIVTASDNDNHLNYIPLMNCIFTAQKLKVSIDVAKLGTTDSSYLQQASDATHGVYLKIEDPRGMIQVLSTAFFIEPNLRPHVIMPTDYQVDYKASCFLTKKPVDLGYVCSVCLCIMSFVPDDLKCPACSSEFDQGIVQELTRDPQVAVVKKKRKLDKANGTELLNVKAKSEEKEQEANKEKTND